jgi:hypothetical protein
MVARRGCSKKLDKACLKGRKATHMLPVYQIIIGSKSKRPGTTNGYISIKQLEWIKTRVKRYAVGYTYDKKMGWYKGTEEESYVFTIICEECDKLVGLCSDIRENFQQESVILINTGVGQFIDCSHTRRAQNAAIKIGKTATTFGKLPKGSKPLAKGMKAPK